MAHAARIAAVALLYQAGLTNGLPPELAELSSDDQRKVLKASKTAAAVVRSKTRKAR